MLEYLEPINCMQTVVILVCKEISSDKLLAYKSYV